MLSTHLHTDGAKGKNLFLILIGCFFLAAGILLIPHPAQSEFFRYVDKHGSVHYVDDFSRIPLEYRKDLKTYQERYDHLSESEKALMREKERQKAEDKRKKPKKNRRTVKKKGPVLKILPRGLVTKVIIEGNKVLVPVNLKFGPKKTTATLVLDTGAEIVTLHQNVAENLDIRSGKKILVQGVGGLRLPGKLVLLTHIEVGRVRKEDIQAVVISPQGAVDYDGLLGMNFLKNLDYKIDFDNQVIRWRH